MHARSAVHMLTFCRVGRGQDSGESADSFEDLVHEWPGQLARVGRAERIDHGGGRCEFPFGKTRALSDQDRIHSRFESVEVLTELLAGVARLEPRSDRWRIEGKRPLGEPPDRKNLEQTAQRKRALAAGERAKAITMDTMVQDVNPGLDARVGLQHGVEL
jgi:hypothetical protein